MGADMKTILTDKIFTPQTFVKALTGKMFDFNEHNPIEQIHNILKNEGVIVEGQEIWDYPKDEIEHIKNEKIKVVLVDVSGIYLKGIHEQVLRWFEVSEFEDCFKNLKA